MVIAPIVSGTLVIVGASVRAAAWSAIRAGFSPTGIDLFADEDLAGACPAHRVEPGDYPAGLSRLAAEAPPGPWMYTGALENHPELIARIAADRPLWGHDAMTVRRARDPIAMADALRRAGLPTLDVRRDPAGLPWDGSWLVKPVRSAGGTGIRPLIGSGFTTDQGEAAYFQRRAVGLSGSAVFVGDGRSARLVGVTRQWIGHEGRPFGYVGSVGPVRVAEGVRESLGRTGAVLAESFGLRGLFGVDFVLEGGVAWPTELNPRYSASVEVIEFATGRCLLRDHAAAFGLDPGRHRTCVNRGHPSRVGKRVVFATADGVVPGSICWPRLDPRRGEFPRLADLPAPGSPFREGQPVLTLLERGGTAEAYRLRLARRLAGWRRRLRGWASGENQSGRPS